MMIPDTAFLRGHLAYHSWANRKLVEAARHLSLEDRTRDFGTSDRNVLGTLVHIFAADRVWIGRVEGNPPARFIDPERDLHFSVLEHDWPVVEQRWSDLALPPDAAIEYRDIRGNAYTSPLWQIVVHLVNHGSHHRGQVSGFLRAMGHVPPPLDLIRYYREGA